MAEIQVCTNEGTRPSQRGDKSEIVISTKFGTKHPWVDGIQIFTNKAPHPSSRGDNSIIIKINGEYLKIFYFRTTCTGPVLTKLGIEHPWVEEIQIFFQIMSHDLLQGKIMAYL